MKFTDEQNSSFDFLESLYEKSWENNEFLKKLISFPKKTIEEAYSGKMNLPENTKLVIEDQTNPNVLYFNIPKKVDMQSIELSDEQLELVSGGEFIVLWCIGAVVVGGVGGYLTCAALSN